MDADLGPELDAAVRAAAKEWTDATPDVAFFAPDATHTIHVERSAAPASCPDAEMFTRRSHGDATIGVVWAGSTAVEVFAHELGHALGIWRHLDDGIMRDGGDISGERVTCREVEALGLACRNEP